MPLTIKISRKAYNAILRFYVNVARKYSQTYTLSLMLKNIDDARTAMLQIENGLSRRKPILTRWRGLIMASYVVDGKTRWNYAYRIEDGTIYVEDACHAQNMSEFSSTFNISTKSKYRKLTKKPLFGYSFVMNDKKEYNLIDKDGRLVTQWFRSIQPINSQKPYGKYQIIAYANVNGFFCALGYDGRVYNLNKTWKEVYTENRQNLDTELFMNIITESIDTTMKNKKVIRLTESDLHRIISESIKNVITEGRNASMELKQAYNILNDIAQSGFIPFASPAPSSTEKAIKDNINSAIRNIEIALELCADCDY